MAATKVLVVDDSLTMRALISSALERIPNVQVVGLADGAAEARALVAQVKPHVMTLDVEMPGTSGIEYLEEIMSSQPMPVIMFSTRTTDGAAESIEALRLGAIDCFPKPRVAAPAELDAIIAKLGKRIKAANSAGLRVAKAASAPVQLPPMEWNGRLLVIGGDASSTATLFDLLSAFPESCPPTIVVQHLGAGLVPGMVDKLRSQIAPRVVIAEDNQPIEQGTVYFAPQGDRHVVLDAWPSGRIRLLARDPVAGERPSISLLFAATAKVAQANALGLLLSDPSEDGGPGLKALLGAGSFAVSLASGGGYTLARNLASQTLESGQLAAGLLKLCSK